MPLDPQVKNFLEAIASLGLPEIHTLTPAAARDFSASRASKLPPGPEADVSNSVVPGALESIAIRVYRPLGNEKKILPVVVYFHGGGFAIGNIDQSDGDCRRLAVGVPCAVVSVEYPLAPENKFPRALTECHAATQWVCEHANALAVDAKRIAVAGDSAGGNLAAAVASLARDRGGPHIVFQVLIYPVADLSRFDTPSHRENAQGLFLTSEAMRWFSNLYLRDAADALDGRASPLLMQNLAGLPPALVITAEFDPLRDEGEALAKRLKDAGVPTTLTRYDGMIHGFFTLSPLFDAGKRATEEVIAALRDAFGENGLV